MYFEMLEHTWLKDAEDLYSRCKECERHVRTNPNNSVNCGRSAVELLSSKLLQRNGVEIPEDELEQTAKKIRTGFERIIQSLERGIITEGQKYLSDTPRHSGNDNMHSDSYGNIIKKAYVKDAVKAFYNLYNFVASCTDKSKQSEVRLDKDKSKNLIYLENRLPIGDYDVLYLMFNEKTNDKIPTYKCRNYENEDDYAIIRRYDRYNKDDARQIRDILAINELAKKARNLPRPVIISNEVSVADSCGYRYIVYRAHKDTFVMSAVKQIANISAKDKLLIFKQIVSILHSLLNLGKGISIHHRALKPNCVFITPNDNQEYIVEIGNFECSKIIDSADVSKSELTVITPDFVKRSQNDVYLPIEVKNDDILNVTSPDWEQIDVYSCAMLLFYLVNGAKPSPEKTEDYLDDIYDIYSPELADITEKIIKSPYGSRPNLNEYLNVINETLKNI